MDASGGRTGLGVSPFCLLLVEEDECLREWAEDGGDLDDEEVDCLSFVFTSGGWTEKDCSNGLGSDSKLLRSGGRACCSFLAAPAGAVGVGEFFRCCCCCCCC